MGRKQPRRQRRTHQTQAKGVNALNLAPPTIALPQLASEWIISPYQVRRRDPGFYYFQNGCMFVYPPEPQGPFLGIEIKDNEQQMQSFDPRAQFLPPIKKQKTSGRKSRITQVTVELDAPQVIDYIFNPYDGSLLIVSNSQPLVPYKTIIENFYERQKKRKIINKFVYTRDHVYHDANAALRRYDQLYAIDTNTFRHPEGVQISVCIVHKATIDSIGQDVSLFNSSPFLWTYSIDISESPEITAWHCFINYFIETSDDLERKIIGIVVDSELSHIENLNLRQTNFAPGFPLPEGFELIYATDASGVDQFAVNKMIYNCDRHAREIARTLKAEPLTLLKEEEDIVRLFN